MKYVCPNCNHVFTSNDEEPLCPSCKNALCRSIEDLYTLSVQHEMLSDFAPSLVEEVKTQFCEARSALNISIWCLKMRAPDMPGLWQDYHQFLSVSDKRILRAIRDDYEALTSKTLEKRDAEDALDDSIVDSIKR